MKEESLNVPVKMHLHFAHKVWWSWMVVEYLGWQLHSRHKLVRLFHTDHKPFNYGKELCELKRLYAVEVIYWRYKDSTLQRTHHNKSKLHVVNTKLSDFNSWLFIYLN